MSLSSGAETRKLSGTAGKGSSVIARLKIVSWGGCFCIGVWFHLIGFSCILRMGFQNDNFEKGGLHVKICCIQMNVSAGAPEENYRSVETLLPKAAKKKPDVIVLPELWNTGFAPGKIDPALADEDGARTKTFCAGLAKKYNINLVAGSVLTRKNGALYNTAYVFDRAGACIAEYDKTHLFSPSGEGEHMSAGDTIVTFPLDGVTCGILICYDLRFAELSRVLALAGAKLLLIPAEWPRARTEQMLTLLRARAIENQVFAALCNGCGEAFGSQFGGSSAIVDPLGRTLARAGRREQICSASIDFTLQEKARKKMPIFIDRRPSLYGLLSETMKKQPPL